MVGHGVLDQSEEWLERIWKWWWGIGIVVVMVEVVFMVATMVLIIRVIVTVAIAVADSVFRVFYPCIDRMCSSSWVVCKMRRWEKATRLSGRR